MLKYTLNESKYRNYVKKINYNHTLTKIDKH